MAKKGKRTQSDASTSDSHGVDAKAERVRSSKTSADKKRSNKKSADKNKNRADKTKKGAGKESSAADSSNRSRSILRKSSSPVVAILTGSPSDLPVVIKAREVLHELDIPCDVRVLSAHRTPVETVSYVEQAPARGFEVIIACAGMAAHLAGVCAAHTTLPVIGLPLASGALQGVDALLATVQMPPGVPVATVGIDNAKNAAFFAARILAARHPEIRERLLHKMEADKARYDAPDPSLPAQADKR